MDDPIVQFLVWASVVLLAMAFLEQIRGDRRRADGWVICTLVAMLVGLIFMAFNEGNGDPLDNCRETGGIQMVHIDGDWQCVPPGQES